jgi:hypothetical protein
MLQGHPVLNREINVLVKLPSLSAEKFLNKSSAKILINFQFVGYPQFMDVFGIAVVAVVRLNCRVHF